MKDKNCLKNIGLILGFIIIVSGNVFVQAFSNLDEMWVFNFGRCIVAGLLPYRDFNLIITPLFPYISASFLKLFGDEMIVLRFAECIETGLILFLVYKILERLKVNKSIALISTLALYFLILKAFCFDYNWMVLLVTFLVLYIELKHIDERITPNFRRDLFLGILVRNRNSSKTNIWYYFKPSIYIL